MHLDRHLQLIRLLTAVALAILFVVPAWATTYYVSTTGSNSNSGTISSPFMTIQKAANVATAGDTVIVRGGVYRETVTMTNSGAAGSPITFKAYNGEQVTVTGLDVVNSGFHNYSGSIYYATNVGSARQVFLNGQVLKQAQLTNSTSNNPMYSTYTSTVDSASFVRDLNGVLTPPTTITDSELGSAGGLSSATAQILSGKAWYSWTGNVVSQNGSTLTLNWPSSAAVSLSYDAEAGDKYYLYGDFGLLDADKEWYYSTTSRALYVHSSQGVSDSIVEVRTRPYGFDFSGCDHVTVSGFQLKAANVIMQSGANYNTVDNCQILYANAESSLDSNYDRVIGVTIYGDHNTVKNSEVAYTWGDVCSV